LPDDDAVTAPAWSKTWCRNGGYETIVVDSGDAAIRHADRARTRQGRFDAVVARSGDARPRRAWGVLAKIREAGLNIPVIVPDGPWRHRQCGVGDARAGAPGFRGESPSASSGCRCPLRNALNASALKR